MKHTGEDGMHSLIDEAWIPAVRVDGHPVDLSLIALFHAAPYVKEISGDIPQQKLPILRLALGILYSAYREHVLQLNPDGLSQPELRAMWKRIWEAGHFDDDVIDSYLERWHDRFFLLGLRPFFQTPDLRYVDDKRPYDSVGEMIADVPKPDKYLFAMRSQGSLSSLSLSEAARWLIFMQAYDTAGIKTPVVGNTHVNKGKVYAPKGMVGTGWQGGIGGTYVEGNSLFETLMLNWRLYDSKGNPLFNNLRDIPCWEYDDPPSSDLAVFDSFAGPVEALTWQSRCIRLIPDPDNSCIIGVVKCYGDIIAPHNTDDYEQMTAWRLSTPQQKKLGLPAPPHMPVLHDSGKALWRSLAPILQVGESGDCRPGVIAWVEELQERQCLNADEHVMDIASIHTQGMTYGTQNSVYETGIDDVVSLHTAMFRHDYDGISKVIDVVSCTDEAVQALANYVRNLHAAAGSKSKGGPSQNTADQVKESAYAQLDALFRDRLVRFLPDCDPENYANEWKDEVHRLLLGMGRDYLSQSSVPVFAGHEAGVAGVMSAARAQLMFQGKLNKILGALPAKRNAENTLSNGKEHDHA